MKIDQIDINALKFGILCNFTPFCGEELAKESVEIVRELERLAEIGRATEKAFEGIYSELLIHDVWPSGDNKGTERIASVEELLEWYKSQEDTDESL